MNVGTYATTIQARAMRDREVLEEAYESYADSFLFWSFIDLVGSSNYRLARGARAGYVRAETFFSLVRGVIAPCEEVSLVKEIGDEVMLSCSEFRPLFESVILLDQATAQLSDVIADDEFPFGIRAALGFGAAKRLVAARRVSEDYVGTPIDELARINALKEGDNIKISREAFEPASSILKEYEEAVAVGSLILVPSGKAKAHLREIYYRCLKVDRSVLAEYRSNFVPWRRSLVEGARRHTS